MLGQVSGIDEAISLVRHDDGMNSSDGTGDGLRLVLEDRVVGDILDLKCLR